MPSPESLIIKVNLPRLEHDPNRSLAQERAEWEDYAKSLPLADGVVVQDCVIAGVRCCWLRPLTADRGQIVLYAHGGGLTSGSIMTHKSFVSRLAKAARCQILMVDYRLLPEHPASAPSEDFLTVYRSLRSSRETASKPIVFAGDSSGGAVVLSSLVQLQDGGEWMPDGAFVFSGAFDATLSGENYQSLVQVDPFEGGAMLAHWQSVLKDVAALGDPLLSPLFSEFEGLPPTLLLAGSEEVWLDDTTRLVERLKAFEVPCQAKIYDGMWHVWPMTPEAMPETLAAFADVSQFLDGLRS